MMHHRKSQATRTSYLQVLTGTKSHGSVLHHLTDLTHLFTPPSYIISNDYEDYKQVQMRITLRSTTVTTVTNRGCYRSLIAMIDSASSGVILLPPMG